jgi:hypothetical protein
MSNLARPHGRLPARVYWFRRAMVLLTALALVFAIGRMLNGSGSGSSDARARVTAGSPSPTSSTPGAVGPLPVQATRATGRSTAAVTPTVLAAPTGPCAVDEITVDPTVPHPVAAGRVALVLELTGIQPACTFTVSSRTLVAKVTSGTDRIWSTQDCPGAIKAATVVVRSAAPTPVSVTWSGRRSDAECSRSTAWALPGYYHLTAAVIGSEPGEAQFRLTAPPRQVITKTAHPKVKKKKKKGTGTVCGGDNSATSC